MSIKKLLLTSIVGALAVPLVAASGAQAQGVGTCTYTGATGSLTNNDGRGGGMAGVESIDTDRMGNDGGPLAGVPGLGDLLDEDNGGMSDGNFGYKTGPGPLGPPDLTTCVVVNDGVAGAPPTGVYGDFPGATGSVEITAGTDVPMGMGTYNNIICGTGEAIGDARATATIQGVDYMIDATVDITFVAGEGVGVISGGADGAAYVNLVPDALGGNGDCVTQDVSRFFASGAFTAAF